MLMKPHSRLLLAAVSLLAAAACGTERGSLTPQDSGSISDADRKYFGPRATLPECNHGELTPEDFAMEPTVDPEAEPTCRWDADTYVEFTCEACGTRPNHLDQLESSGSPAAE